MIAQIGGDRVRGGYGGRDGDRWGLGQVRERGRGQGQGQGRGQGQEQEQERGGG